LTLGAHHAVAMRARRGYVPAMGETSLMTAEELLRLNLPDKRTELIRGRLVVRDPGGARHGAVANRIAYRITAHVEAVDLGRVYAAETGFKIESDPDTVRAPDVAFIAKHRLPEVEPRGYPGWAPDLAVEVLAHDDHPAETLEKIAQWLKAGVRLVWVVDSEKRTARVYRADGSEALLGPNETLDGEDVLPGFHCPLAALW
jgi:Uma2 family endonuclease